MPVTSCTFLDDRGRVVPAVDASEMLEVDRIAIEETGPNLFQMMENAGRSLATEALSMLREPNGSSTVLILAGTGGNGGGGITAGRHLLNHRVGDVIVTVTGRTSLGDVPAQQLELFAHAGGDVVEGPISAGSSRPGLVIDAIIGYSLQGAPRGRALEMIDWANAAGAPILALDIASGIDATSGGAPGAAVVATKTMTLALPKHGLCASQCGELVLADIGLPAEVYRRLGRPEGGAIFDGRYRVPLQRNLTADE